MEFEVYAQEAQQEGGAAGKIVIRREALSGSGFVRERSGCRPDRLLIVFSH
jgi:hypothetical protein